ncbi:glutamine synthetase family protein [Streptomyces sp. ISL-11]|uniref:glutamine synthetase family protein n=1 Tax=Streptomyces sp. ISL-11 TaxID=2819174 RepID=UPI001BE5FA4B|nr:glutamine synthetase family protein [Streptomyces sp. ISL-11]MBT2384465.1 glutamine synthetase [Streptomyces sp. ISL-11]
MTTVRDLPELDQHRERNTDEAAVEAVRTRMAESGVEYVYYQTVTVTGRVIGKVVPARHLARNVEHGVQMHRTVLADLQTDRHGTLLGGGCGAAEFTAMPDLDTFAVLPWDTRMGRFFCRLYESAHTAGDIGGRALGTDARGNLHQVHAAFTERTGLELRTGCEPELSWSGPGLEPRPRPHTSPAYHVDHLERYRPIYQKVIAYGQALGLDMIEGDYEDPGQLELNWMYDHADRTADRLVVHRQICRQVARELGVTVSFMPKPANDRKGNGCHHNLSLWRGEENVLADPGTRQLHLTDIGRHAIGGILAHTTAMTAVMGPTVNSYKRYWHASQFAPTHANWGMDNKTCSVRLSANGRLEFKLPDAMVNPYLSHAVLLAAIEDGIKNRTDPGPAHEGAGYAEAASPAAALPMTLGEAVAEFVADPVVTGALGPELTDLFQVLKADEWARFCGSVTDWEHAMYAEEGC